ncbi:MAG: aspartyl/glutamyl-tRNA(Asn/Gln) amidotransferase C subunit, partial [Phycisphaerales bacterium]
QPLDHPTELLNHLREDTCSDTLSQQQVLANAPEIKDVYFAVPKVLGEST